MKMGKSLPIHGVLSRDCQNKNQKLFFSQNLFCNCFRKLVCPALPRELFCPTLPKVNSLVTLYLVISLSG